MNKEIFLHRLSYKEKKLKPLKEWQINLIEKNMELIYFLANKYKSKFLSKDDTIAECSFLACRVAEIFKPELGFKFSTVLARSWLRHLSRINQVYRSPRNGYRETISWRAGKDVDGNIKEDDIAMENDPADIAEVRDETEKMRAIIDTLTSKRKAVINGRLDGRTLDNIGKEIGVTRERVRQIECEAKKTIMKKFGTDA